MGWISGHEIMVWESSPKAPIAIFANSSQGKGIAPDGKWHTINLCDKLPLGAKAVNLSGLLLITHGLQEEIANLRLYLRKNSDTNPGYNYQAIETSTKGGQRSPMSAWVSLSDNCTFDVKWVITNPDKKWPEYSSYGINLTINAVLR